MGNDFCVKVGKNIKSKRNELGLTMKELGEKVGLSESTIQRYESGKIKNLDTQKLHEFSIALKTTDSFLTGWEEEDKISDALVNVMYNDLILEINTSIKDMPDKYLKRLLKYAELIKEEIEEEKEND